MSSDHDPMELLDDIVENAGRIEHYMTGLDRGAFEDNGLVRDAVERCLERICEAAHRFGRDAEVLLPGHSWRDIRGMGNRLRHAYDRISTDMLWDAIVRDLPPLAADARMALARHRGASRPEDA